MLRSGDWIPILLGPNSATIVTKGILGWNPWRLTLGRFGVIGFRGGCAFAGGGRRDPHFEA